MIALALGGGGLRGAAHIGILQVLLENGLRPDLVVGSSAGSLVGTLFAAGISPDKMLALINRLRWPPWARQPAALSLEAFPANRGYLTGLPLGLLKGSGIEKALARLTGGRSMDDLALPAAVVATDLYDGRAVVFASNRLLPPRAAPATFQFLSGTPAAAAVRASIAIPGIFSPREIDRKLLVDGGLVDNVPADVAGFLGAERVVAVDLGFAVEQATPFRNLFEILLQAYEIMGQRVADLVTGNCADLVLRPATGPAALWDIGRLPAMAEAGRQEALRNLSQLKRVFQR